MNQNDTYHLEARCFFATCAQLPALHHWLTTHWPEKMWNWDENTLVLNQELGWEYFCAQGGIGMNTFLLHEEYVWELEVELGCRASAIIYRKTRVYGDYPLIIAINVSPRQLTLQPIATPNENTYVHNEDWGWIFLWELIWNTCVTTWDPLSKGSCTGQDLMCKSSPAFNI